MRRYISYCATSIEFDWAVGEDGGRRALDIDGVYDTDCACEFEGSREVGSVPPLIKSISRAAKIRSKLITDSPLITICGKYPMESVGGKVTLTKFGHKETWNGITDQNTWGKLLSNLIGLLIIEHYHQVLGHPACCFVFAESLRESHQQKADAL